MTAYDPVQWDNFCNAFSNASGALLGLALVAITINLRDILEDKRLPRRAIETLIFLAYPLGASLLIQVPGLSNRGAGIGQAAFSAELIGLAILDVPRWRRDDPDEPLSWTLTEVVPGAVIAVFATVGAVATLTHSFGGLYWLAGAMGIATASGADEQLGVAGGDQTLTDVWASTAGRRGDAATRRGVAALLTVSGRGFRRASRTSAVPAARGPSARCACWRLRLW
jgi:hypothetical protein